MRIFCDQWVVVISKLTWIIFRNDFFCKYHDRLLKDIFRSSLPNVVSKFWGKGRRFKRPSSRWWCLRHPSMNVLKIS